MIGVLLFTLFTLPGTLGGECEQIYEIAIHASNTNEVQSGSIESDGYPFDYPRNVSQCWHIRAQPGHILRLLVVAAKFENCNENVSPESAVKIFDVGANGVSTCLVSMCSKSNKHDPDVVKTKSNEALIQLETRGDSSRKRLLSREGRLMGMLIHYEQLVPDPFYNVTQVENITVPDKGSLMIKLPANVNNYLRMWDVTVTSSVHQHFDVIWANDVKYNLCKLERCLRTACDYVAIYPGINSSSVTQYLVLPDSEQPPNWKVLPGLLNEKLTFKSSSHFFTIVEHTDSTEPLSDQGNLCSNFLPKCMFVQVPSVSPSEGTKSHYLEGPASSITFQAPSYALNSEYFWRFFVDPDSIIFIYIDKFSIEHCTGCSCDYLAVYDGGLKNNSSLLTRVCGSRENDNFRFKTTNNEVLVEFVSDTSIIGHDAQAPSGFIMTITEVDDEPVENMYEVNSVAPGEFIRKPDTESGYCPNNSTLIWRIHASSQWASIAIFINSVALEFGNFDNILLYDVLPAGLEDDTVDFVYKLPQNEEAIEIGKAYTPTLGGSAVVVFKSDATISSDDFSLLVIESEPAACAISGHREFLDLGSGAAYFWLEMEQRPKLHGRTTCKWEIMRSPQPYFHLKVYVEFFDMGVIEECYLWDIVQITVDSSTTVLCDLGKHAFKFNAGAKPTVYVSWHHDYGIFPKSSRKMKLVVYELLGSSVEVSCSVQYLNESNVISNANVYDDNMNCTWEVEVPADRIRFTITIFWIEFCSRCQCDALNIYEAGSAIPFERVCNDESNSLTMTAYSMTTKATIQFKTDNSGRPPWALKRNGFELTYERDNSRCRNTNATAIKRTNPDEITSFEYPHIYNANISCHWVIDFSVNDTANITVVIATHWLAQPGTDKLEVRVYETGFERFIDYFSITEPDVSKQIQLSYRNSLAIYFETGANELLRRPTSKPHMTAGFSVSFEYYFTEMKFENADETAVEDKNWIIILACSLSAGAIIFVSSVYFAKKRVQVRKMQALIEKYAQSESNYVCPITNFKDLLRETGNERLLSMVESLSLSSDCLKVDTDNAVGSGYFGLVYRGKLTTANTTMAVAVKCVKSSQLADLITFLEEAHVMSTLHHPNVLRLIGISTVLEKPTAILPFMANGDLKSLLLSMDQSKVDISSLVDYCLQICNGMAYLASKKCIHRDLACRNVLVDADGTLKISDFGLAKQVVSEEYYRSESNEKPLPIRWHPPESLRYRIFETKSDVWSFGVVMWEIFTLCRCTPYDGLDNSDIILKVCDGELRLGKPTLCPEQFFTAAVLPCWQAERKSRPHFCKLVPIISQYR